MSEPLVQPLTAAADRALAGGKASALGALLRAGLPVPPALVLTTHAYARFLADNALADRIEAVVRALDTSPLNLRRAADQIRQLFAAASWPGTLEDALAGGLGDLHLDAAHQLLAVRSSAPGEDLASQSFAGQLESRLGVRPGPLLAPAIRDCWASLWSARALAYRQQLGGDSSPTMALLLQSLVPARCAGVLFTCDPLRGDRGVLVIEAVRGLGKTLVDGTTTPDRWLVDKPSGAVRSYSAGDQVERLAVVAGEVRVAGLGSTEPAGPPLSASEVVALAELGRVVEATFGQPQDIEWAVRDDGSLAILQARPLTALPS